MPPQTTISRSPRCWDVIVVRLVELLLAAVVELKLKLSNPNLTLA
jgi:hypothetical protein